MARFPQSRKPTVARPPAQRPPHRHDTPPECDGAAQISNSLSLLARSIHRAILGVM